MTQGHYTRIYLKYVGQDDPLLWFQQLVVGKVASLSSEYVTYTPDAELLRVDIEDKEVVLAYRWGQSQDKVPTGISRKQIYGFADKISDNDIADLREELIFFVLKPRPHRTIT